MFNRLDLVEFSTLKSENDLLSIELSQIHKDNLWRAEEIISELVSRENDVPEIEIQTKWLYVVLRLLYERKEEFSDPWEQIENVYEDFGHPQEIRNLVRYIPKDRTEYDPVSHTREENIQRLFMLWKSYLDENNPDKNRKIG